MFQASLFRLGWLQTLPQAQAQRSMHCYFPFSHLLASYAPLMKIIMKYFTCEGRFSRVYAYHIRLLMHFTRTKQLNLPYFLYKSIEKMASPVQKKSPSQQVASLFHHSLIKISILHQLEKKGVSWDVFYQSPGFLHCPSGPYISHIAYSSPLTFL